MNRTESTILAELLEKIEQLQRHSGSNPGNAFRFSVDRIRKDLGRFADKCRRGELDGRARKRKFGELFRRVIALDPKTWV